MNFVNHHSPRRTADERINTRIDADVKAEAEAVFAELGMSMSGAIRLFLTKTAREKRLPFDLTPNEETVRVMRDAEAGVGLAKMDSMAGLIQEIEAQP